MPHMFGHQSPISTSRTTTKKGGKRETTTVIHDQERHDDIRRQEKNRAAGRDSRDDGGSSRSSQPVQRDRGVEGGATRVEAAPQQGGSRLAPHIEQMGNTLIERDAVTGEIINQVQLPERVPGESLSEYRARRDAAFDDAVSMQQDEIRKRNAQQQQQPNFTREDGQQVFVPPPPGLQTQEDTLQQDRTFLQKIGDFGKSIIRGIDKFAQPGFWGFLNPAAGLAENFFKNPSLLSDPDVKNVGKAALTASTFIGAAGLLRSVQLGRGFVQSQGLIAPKVVQAAAGKAPLGTLTSSTVRETIKIGRNKVLINTYNARKSASLLAKLGRGLTNKYTLGLLGTAGFTSFFWGPDTKNDALTTYGIGVNSALARQDYGAVLELAEAGRQAADINAKIPITGFGQASGARVKSFLDIAEAAEKEAMEQMSKVTRAEERAQRSLLDNVEFQDPGSGEPKWIPKDGGGVRPNPRHPGWEPDPNRPGWFVWSE